MSNSPKKLSRDETRTYLTLKYGSVIEALEFTIEPGAKEIMGIDFKLVQDFVREGMSNAFRENIQPNLIDKKK